MRRRYFIAGLGAIVAWPMSARSQQGMRRIGILVRGAEEDLIVAFRQALERVGWSQGRNVRIDIRLANKADEFQQLAKELVALQPEVIFTQTTPVVAALQRESRTIPIAQGLPAV
jgi:putative ABC transport system substrate-binding protein